jgi:hypothetical protein
MPVGSVGDATTTVDAELNSAPLTAIDNRAGVAPPTTTVPTEPVVIDGVGAALDSIGEAGALLEGELGGGLDATLAVGALDGESTGAGEFEGAARWLRLPVQDATTSAMIAAIDA